MLQSILIPTDFSENALAACQYALAIARKFNCNAHIAHCYKAFHSGFQSEEANEKDRMQAETEAQQELEKLLQKLQIKTEIRITYEVYEGDLTDAVLHWVEDKQADLIVMGSGGGSEPQHKLMGNNAFDVATLSSVPVIVVPLSPENFRLEHITFFTNYNEGDVEAMRKLNDLFGIEGSVYRLIHIHESPEKPSNADINIMQEWAALLGRKVGIDHLAWELVNGEENATLVEEIAARSNIDLLVMTVEREGFFERLFDHDLPREVIRQSKTPVLLIRSYNSEEG
jgi:nucleotide-binding universal stress UspA family protein